jgi:hypothetical protein
MVLQELKVTLCHKNTQTESRVTGHFALSMDRAFMPGMVWPTADFCAKVV